MGHVLVPVSERDLFQAVMNVGIFRDAKSRNTVNDTSMKKNIYTIFASCFLQLGFSIIVYGTDPIIVDSRHYSTVFAEIRNYRVFLPSGYYDNPGKKYPVVYFLHGWSMRYFGNSGEEYSEFGFDKDQDNKGDNIAKFVSNHDVIVVRPDGYNREPGDPYYLRPYNVGPVETHRQFPLYFPELIDHIDSHYRTIADREHRGICGLSMGGFMSYWIGGKYPHLFSAVGNFCGSAEFVVGPKHFPVEYRHLDFYKNYRGQQVRLHYGDKDFIRDYHRDMTRIWGQVMDNFEYRIFPGTHATTGLGEMMMFMLNTFNNPPSRPARWDHIDVYPEFSVWDYEVTSDRNVPGLTILENVDKRGFRCAVREFFPDGELMPFVSVSITTPPLYEKDQLYVISDIDTKTLKHSQQTVRTDKQGRLTICLNGGSHEVGINKKSDLPNPCIASIEIENRGWVIPKADVTLSVKLLNKGQALGKNITLNLSAARNSTQIIRGVASIGNLAVNEVQTTDIPFTFRVLADSVEIVKLLLRIEDDTNHEWIESFEIPVKKAVPEIKDFAIADGKTFTVTRSGIDLETTLLGHGNGDGIPNPGESIVILIKEQEKYWRTDLTFSDPYINPSGLNHRMSDNWTDFDHVGASMKYDEPLISSDCPAGRRMEFLVEYYVPEYPFHHRRQGRVAVEVQGRDQTAPKIRWVQIPGDNLVQVKLFDGSRIQGVKAKLILRDEPTKSIEVELNDDGLAGDRAAGDNIFSKKIEEQKFGIYRLLLEAKDAAGNTMVQEAPGAYVVY